MVYIKQFFFIPYCKIYTSCLIRNKINNSLCFDRNFTQRFRFIEPIICLKLYTYQVLLFVNQIVFYYLGNKIPPFYLKFSMGLQPTADNEYGLY